VCSSDLARVTLAVPDGAVGARVTAAGTGVELRGLTVRGGTVGVHAVGGAQLALRGLVVRESTDSAVAASGAGTRVTARDVVVTDRLAGSSGLASRGLEVFDGAAFDGARIAVVRRRRVGVVVDGAETTVVLADAVVRDTQLRDDGGGGTGLLALNGGRLAATRVLVADNHSGGAIASGAGSALELTDAIVRGTAWEQSGQFGYALEAVAAGRVSATRAFVGGNHGIGALADGDGSALVLTDAIVEATAPGADRERGVGILASGGSRVEATRVRVAANRLGGVLATTGARVALADAVVRDTAADDHRFGAGIGAFDGAQIEVDRVLVTDNAVVGAGVSGDGARLALRDAIVRSTQPLGDGLLGYGFAAQAGGHLEAARVLAADNQMIGVQVLNPGSEVRLTDSALVATRPTMALLGRGVVVSGGGAFTTSGTLIADHHESGVIVFDPGSSAVLTDSIISGVAPSAQGFGVGAIAFGAASLALDRVAVTRVHGVGVAAVPDDAADGTRVTGASVTGIDLYFRDVRSSTIRFADVAGQPRPTGRLVAYGLHVGDGCTLDARRAVAWTGGYGFFAAAGSAFAWRTGVITGQLDAAGVANGVSSAHPFVLDDVAAFGNATDATLHDLDLPEAGSLAVPTAPCTSQVCP
jgi:hypothetical protein